MIRDNDLPFEPLPGVLGWQVNFEDANGDFRSCEFSHPASLGAYVRTLAARGLNFEVTTIQEVC